MKWQPIATAPKDGTAVWLTNEADGEVCGSEWVLCDIGVNGRYAWSFTDAKWRPTHWMLREIPKPKPLKKKVS